MPNRRARLSHRRIFANLGSVGLLKGLSDACVFGTFVFLARHFSAEGLGEYSFAMALTGFLSLAGNFGFDSYAIREVARAPDRESLFFGNFVTLATLLCTALWLALFGVAAAIGFDSRRAQIVLTIGAFQILYAFSMLIVGRFKAHEQVVAPAVLEALLRLALLVGSVAIALAGAPLEGVLVAFPLGMVAFVGISVALIRRRGYPALQYRLRPGFLRAHWSELWPFGLSRVLFAAYATVDVIVIGLLRSDAEVGIYSAAYRPLFGLIALFSTATLAAYPTFSRLYEHSRAELCALFERLVDLLTMGFGLIGFGLFCLAEPIVRAIYGESFAAAAFPLRWLTPLLVITSLNSAAEHLLAAANQQRARMVALLTSLVVSVALNLWFVSQYGVPGAVAGVLIAEIFLCAQLFLSVRSCGLEVGLVRQLARTGAGLAVGGAVWYGLGSVDSPWIACAAGTVAYVGVVGLAGGWRAISLWRESLDHL